MKEEDKAKAVIYGSFILYLLDKHLDNEFLTNATSIRVRMRIAKKISGKTNHKYVPYRLLSNQCWSTLMNNHEDENIKMSIFDFIEALVMEATPVFDKFYGKELAREVSSFVIKHTPDDPDREATKNARDLAEELIQIVNKTVYDYFKEDS